MSACLVSFIRQAAAQVRAAGATPKLVTRSTARLERVKAALDAAGTAPVGSSWGVDVATDTVLVSVPAGKGAAFLSRARSFGAAVRVQRSPAVQTQAFYGGQAILHSGARCSAGFITRSGSGRNYVLTAGHCTNLGGTWTTSSGQTIGPVAASSFPGNDFGAIRISDPAALDPRGGVLCYGAFQDITGPAGSRSGPRPARPGRPRAPPPAAPSAAATRPASRASSSQPMKH